MIDRLLIAVSWLWILTGVSVMSPSVAQTGATELQQLQQRFTHERLELERQQANQQSGPAFDRSQRQRQWLLQEQQRREALGFAQQSRSVDAPERLRQWQAEQQRLQRERDAQMLQFRQEMLGSRARP